MPPAAVGGFPHSLGRNAGQRVDVTGGLGWPRGWAGALWGSQPLAALDVYTGICMRLQVQVSQVSFADMRPCESGNWRSMVFSRTNTGGSEQQAPPLATVLPAGHVCCAFVNLLELLGQAAAED